MHILVKRVIMALLLLVGASLASAAPPAFSPAFSPDIPSKHLAFLDCAGPYAEIDRACIEGTRAALRVGELVGYTGWCQGEYPELIEARDGQLYALPSAADGRTPSRCHDPLPWLTVFCSNNRALGDRLHAAVRANLRINMPLQPGTFEFAHKGTEPGWCFRSDSGGTGHWAHIENAIYLYRSTGDLQAREISLNWLKAKVHRTPAYNRDTHTHFVRLWLTWLHSSDPWYKTEAIALAKFLISKPLAEQESPLYHPNWPYYVWQVATIDPRFGDPSLKPAVEKWIVEAADQMTTAGLSRLTVSACAYWITKDANYLTRELQEIVDWSCGYLRAPGTRYHMLGMQPGRTGDGYVPNQWPIFRRALIDAGSPPLPAVPSVNTIPLHRAGGRSGTVMALGADLRNGLCRFRAGPFGGDTHGGAVYRIVDGMRSGRVLLEGPYRSGQGEAPFTFNDATAQLEVLAYEQVLGPLTADETERYKLTPGVKYDMGTARGTLETTGTATVESRVGPVTFYRKDGTPWNWAWAGLSKRGFSFTGGGYLEARCRSTSAWTLTVTQPGIWRPAR